VARKLFPSAAVRLIPPIRSIVKESAPKPMDTHGRFRLFEARLLAVRKGEGTPEERLASPCRSICKCPGEEC